MTTPSPLAQVKLKAFEQTSGINAEINLPHFHSSNYRILWFRYGNGHIYIDGRKHKLSRESLYCIPARVLHRVEFTTASKGFSLEFAADLITEPIFQQADIDLHLLFQARDIKALKLDSSMVENLEPLAQVFETESAHTGNRDERLLQTYLLAFLLNCDRFYRKTAGQLELSERRSNQIVKRFAAALQTHFKTCHQVQYYAQELNLSASHLNDVIKAETGRNAKAHIQERLLNEAEHLALHSSLRGSSIARQLGFTDPPHFSKFFKSRTGLSFQEFRLACLAWYERNALTPAVQSAWFFLKLEFLF